MEIHRLTPMKDDYPVELFNKLYKETKNLRKNLARNIDHRRYGVTHDIVLSWFDDKFIFVFNKHFQSKEPEVLRGFLINSLQTFKMRILRKAYQKEGEFYSSLVTMDGDYDLINIIPDQNQISNEDLFYNLAIEFMKNKLSDDAYLLLQLQLNPPPYILSRIKGGNSRIPNELIMEFLDIDKSEPKAERYIKKLKKEINIAIKNAKEYFKENNPLAFSH
jgi:hypothetical protein